MAKKSALPETHASAFFEFGRQYQKAAGLLFESDETLTYPIYFLYSHAIELALKAYLRAANLPVVTDRKRKTHQIAALYEECRAIGLRIGPDDRTDIGNIVALLEGANENQGLRYASKKGISTPDLAWTRDTVGKLFTVIEPSVTSRAKADGLLPARAARFGLTFRKAFPTPTDGE